MESVHAILAKFGFEKREIEFYLFFIENGELTVPMLQTKTGLSRTAIYTILKNLENKKCVESRKEGRVVFYRASHPSTLAALSEQKKVEVGLLAQEMEETIRQLAGPYSTMLGKPGMRIYEGWDGIKEATFHSLQSKEEILTFSNITTVAKHAAALDAQYVQKRVEQKIKKRIIALDTTEARQFEKNIDYRYTTIRYINQWLYPFELVVEIYGDYVCFLTVKDGVPLAALLNHSSIAQFHRSLFEYVWKTLPAAHPVRGN